MVNVFEKSTAMFFKETFFSQKKLLQCIIQQLTLVFRDAVKRKGNR